VVKTRKMAKPTRTIKVYLAAPYSHGDREANLRRSIDIAEELMVAGFVVFNPLLDRYHQAVHRHEHSFWMEQGKAWIDCCDMVMRIPGQSLGADEEEDYAEKLNIPVLHNVNMIKSYFI